MGLGNIGLPGVLLLAFFALIFVAHYKVSRKIGFGTGASVLIAISGFFGLAVFIWWLSPWPKRAIQNVFG